MVSSVPSDTDEGSSGPRIEGPLRVDGIARIARGVRCTGDVHAPAGLELGADAIVEGDVYTDGSVERETGAHIAGGVFPARGPDPSLEDLGEALAMVDTLLQDAETEAGLDESGLAFVREQVARTCLDHPPEEAWPHHVIHHVLYGQVLASAHPISVETKDREASIVRIRETTERSTQAVARVAERLGQAARPSLELHPLSAPDTRGDAVLLVEP